MSLPFQETLNPGKQVHLGKGRVGGWNAKLEKLLGAGDTHLALLYVHLSKTPLF